MNKDISLTGWLVKKVEKDYKDDICLLLTHQALKLEPDRNIQCPSFFIPATNRAMGIARTFIVDGVGYDIFPMGWERIERMADVKDYNTTCLANAEIVYARSDDDRARFLSLQARLTANLQNPQLMRERAKDWLGTITDIYREMLFARDLSAVRSSAGHIADLSCLCVAFMNGRFFEHGQTNQLLEVEKMGSVPDGFAALYRAIPRAADAMELKKLCHELITLVKAFVEGNKDVANGEPDYSELAGWYQELIYTFRRVYYFIGRGEVENAFIWACGLQTEIDEIAPKYRLTDVDLLANYRADELSAFKARVEAAQRTIVSAIESHGVQIEAYGSIDEFLTQNS